MIALVAAIAENNCIGNQGQIPWRLPEDMKHFKELTVGKIVLMGRKTWESLPAKFRPLPDRVNVIITHQKNFPVPAGVLIYQSIDEALRSFPEKEMMIIGGAQIYRETIGRADTLYITHVKQTVAGDTFFPVIDPAIWKEAWRKDHDGFSFVKYIKN